MFPASLYPSNTGHIRRLKIAACFQCNKEWAKHEAFSRSVMSASGPDPTEERLKIIADARRSFRKPKSGRRDLKELREHVETLPIFKLNGLPYGRINAHRIARMGRVASKIIRGLVHNVCAARCPERNGGVSSGTGKTMLASRMPGILPPLSREEALETTRIYSALGLLPDGIALLDRRPVRSPHHSATAQALVGGGSNPRPGEASMAHNGILFLDELPEFGRNVLEMLRQPLESGDVVISRAVGAMRFPARFMMVAAMNPTPGGQVAKNPGAKNKYMDRLSGPLLDRIDLHVNVPAVAFGELAGKRVGTNSATMRADVDRARATQRARFGKLPITNARMDSRLLREHAELSDDCLRLMKQAMDELGLSARAYDKVRRVARTIADLEGSATITEAHVAEGVQYRLLDRKL